MLGVSAIRSVFLLLSRAAATKTVSCMSAGHHSRFVRLFYYLPAPHALVGIDRVAVAHCPSESH